MRRCAPLLIVAILAAAPVCAAEPEALQSSPQGCVDTRSNPAQKQAAADHVLGVMMGPVPGAAPMPTTEPLGFGDDLFPIAQQNIFGNLWARCGLSRRDRSLVTLGVLIALRAENELRYHFPIALRNGLTRRELEEVVYQAGGYAGFPAAASASRVAGQVLPRK